MKKIMITEVGEDTETPGYYVKFKLPKADARSIVPGLAYLSKKYVWTHIAGGKPEDFQIAQHVESFISEHYNAVSAQLVHDPYVFFVNTPTIDRRTVRARFLP